MNGKNIYDALEFVGADLIDMAEKQQFSKPFYRTALRIAAMVAVLIGVGTASVQLLREPAIDTPPSQTEPVVEKEAPVLDPPPAEDEPVDTVHPLLKMFPQLDEASLTAYLDARPELADCHWDTFYLNEAGLGDPGTEICTIRGDQVLAIDAENGILLIRIQGEGYRGVLAISNHPQNLALQTASTLGVSGETVGDIAAAHDGILAISGSRVHPEYNGTGEVLYGYVMSSGVEYNSDAHMEPGLFRVEINGEGTLSIVETQDPVSPDVHHAIETQYVLIRDGEIVVDDALTGSLLPRACIGQTETGAVLMMVIEGWQPETSLGTDQPTCAAILRDYGCVNAVHQAHGSQAVLWFDGECVTRCSNPAMPEGRLVPSVFVVARQR